MKLFEMRAALSAAVLVSLAPAPAWASYHLMQIEQVIGGVNGDPTAQGIQLRMRYDGQNLLHNARLVVRDATGSNPILVCDMTTDVTNAAAGSRVLIASSAFAGFCSTPPDFLIENLIPPSYLAAGSLTFERDGDLVLWRLSWGGANYTGPGTADLLINDEDGDFNPPYPGVLQNGDLRAVQFKYDEIALSTDNASDYQLSSSPAQFTNNAGVTSPVTPPACVCDPPIGSVMLTPPVPNPSSGEAFYSVRLPATARVKVQIFDVRGRLIRNLVDRTLSPGLHPFDIRTDDGLENGVYYLRLDAGSVRSAQKFAIVR